MNQSQIQNISSTFSQPLSALLALLGFSENKKTDLPTFHILQPVKSLSLYIPEAWKRYPFQ